MTDAEKSEQIEAVDLWIDKFRVQLRTNKEGLTIPHVEITEIDTMLLRNVLGEYGAKFNLEKEGYQKLSQPTNKFRRSGMDAVWGAVFMDNYNLWTVQWANEYEKTGRKLPKLDISGNRTSGMRHLLGEITAYAAGKLSFDDFKEKMDARIVNGFTYAKGLGKTATTFLPEDKRFPGSIPPYFTENAWNVVKSRDLVEKVPVVILPSETTATG